MYLYIISSNIQLLKLGMEINIKHGKNNIQDVLIPSNYNQVQFFLYKCTKKKRYRPTEC